MRGKNVQQIIHPDSCPDLVVERGPKNEGVGSWVPEQKHRLLSEYLHATRHAWKKWPNRAFVDPFAEMPLVRNDQGHGIYRMVFFARHDLPNRIWGDVAQGPNRSFVFDE